MMDDKLNVPDLFRCLPDAAELQASDFERMFEMCEEFQDWAEREESCRRQILEKWWNPEYNSWWILAEFFGIGERHSFLLAAPHPLFYNWCDRDYGRTIFAILRRCALGEISVGAGITKIKKILIEGVSEWKIMRLGLEGWMEE